MIVEWLWGIATGFAGWVLSWFDGFELPDWWFTFSDVIAQVVASAVGMGAWVPWEVLFAVIGILVGTYALLISIKGARWLVGWIPTMGGS